MSTATAPRGRKPKKKAKSPQGKKSRVQMEVEAVLQKFRLSEQVDIRRNWELLPKVIISAWRECFTHLDFDEFQQQLQGESLYLFLSKMRRHFTSVSFKNEQLQEQLNILDRSGIAELPGVRECEITWDGKETENSTQWPLHALPKLMKRLSNLQVHSPVQVGFIEHFPQLRNLTLYADVSREALGAIWSSCKGLKRLKLLGYGAPNTIGISQCKELCELALPMAAFNASTAFEVLQMSQLLLLELLQNDESTEAAIESISLVLRQRALDVRSMRMHNCHMCYSNWLPKLELHRCIHMRSLTIESCLFREQDMLSMETFPVLRKATFIHCSDLNDEQILNFTKACPHLSQLNMLDCSHLTTKFLYDLCKWRCGIKVGAPALQLNLGEAEKLKEEFRQHFVLQTTLELLEVPQTERSQLPREEDSQEQYVQFLFLPPVSK